MRVLCGLEWLNSTGLLTHKLVHCSQLELTKSANGTNYTTMARLLTLYTTGLIPVGI